MAAIDFRESGFGFTRSRQRARRDHDFEQNGWDDSAAQTQTYPDDRRFAADPAGDGLPNRLGRLTHYLGAVVSVGLMVGLMTWGWQLMVRDVSGVPVIKALIGDSRTMPDDPGGELTGHTGYAVNDVASGTAATPTEQVAIAPDATGLDATDVAMGEFGAIARDPLTAIDTPLNFDGDPLIAMTDAAAADAARAAAEAAAQAVAAAQISEEPASEGTVTAVVTDENGEIADTDAINLALAEAQIPVAAPAVARSSRPAPRPRLVNVVAASAPAPAAAAPTRQTAETAPPAPAPAPAPVVTASAGGPQVQIGAFDSDSIAQSEWGRVSGKFGSLFNGKSPVVQAHESAGRTFWRLRVAGFTSIADAREFCNSMKSGGTDCIALTQ